jgi:tRNA A37 threonylcarbamoyladenosine modification protein TsaB
MRAALGRFAGLRGAAFVAAGLGWALGLKLAPLLALPGMAQFLLALASVKTKPVSR